ncbi:10967_t:CDS:2 [Scutellospora calospora]|uniref:10967_t:CDS:1 n=1 Tax=Scutellospora calospora TaxID=85575 RepID=A0ACA9K7G2_9GLOM|nr:10967_t:CDS:2 [Scutellospora calospora]
MKKRTFWIIVDLIKDHKVFNGQDQKSVELQLFVTLFLLGRRSTIWDIAAKFGASKVSIIRYMHRVIIAIKSLRSRYIVWPREDYRKQVYNGFAKIEGFPDVISVVDGTHINLFEAPKKLNKDQPDATASLLYYTQQLDVSILPVLSPVNISKQQFSSSIYQLNEFKLEEQNKDSSLCQYSDYSVLLTPSNQYSDYSIPLVRSNQYSNYSIPPVRSDQYSDYSIPPTRSDHDQYSDYSILLARSDQYSDRIKDDRIGQTYISDEELKITEKFDEHIEHIEDDKIIDETINWKLYITNKTKFYRCATYKLGNNKMGKQPYLKKIDSLFSSQENINSDYLISSLTLDEKEKVFLYNLQKCLG